MGEKLVSVILHTRRQDDSLCLKQRFIFVFYCSNGLVAGRGGTHLQSQILRRLRQEDHNKFKTSWAT